MKNEIENKVIEFIKENNLIEKGEKCKKVKKVTVAFSGGADSTALLLLLNNLKEKLGITLNAVHVNHHLRGEESDSDQKFCEEICRKYGIPLDVKDVDVTGTQKNTGGGSEEVARRLRYAEFAKYDCIATAHTASDNIETSIYNYMRGSGLKGIAGIPPKRDNIIRPVLCLTRSETEEYVHECGESFVTDSTNLTDDFARNRIRHHLIPLMKEQNPNLEETGKANLEILRTQQQFIEEETDRVYERIHMNGKLYCLADYHPAIRQQCIIKYLKENNISYDFKRIREIEKVVLNGGKCEISNGKFAVCRNNRFFIEEETEYKTVSKPLHEGVNTIFEGHSLTAECYEDENIVKKLKINKKFTKFLIDCDKIIGVPLLRSRKYGDKIKPFDRDFHVSIKKWLQSNVDADMRKYMHYITDGNGKLIWAEGIGPSHTVAPDENTKRIMAVSVSHDTGEMPEIMISPENIRKRVCELGKEFTEIYRGKKLLVIGILKGSMAFMSDLIKEIRLPLEVDYMRVSSYGSGTVSNGNVKIILDTKQDLTGYDVLIAEDIMDSGNTLFKIRKMLYERNPNSLTICTLLDKPSRRTADITPDFTGFEISDRFVMGYGLDVAERYRNLPFIGEFRAEKQMPQFGADKNQKKES